MSSREIFQTRWPVAGLLFLVIGGSFVVGAGGVRGARQLVGWLGVAVHRTIFPEQGAAGPIYTDTARGPLSLATTVAQFRSAWPGESVVFVHHAAGEVAADLLHHGDIEVGGLENGKFIPWPMKPWQAEEIIRDELRAMPGFLTDENRYVFRRKPAAN